MEEKLCRKCGETKALDDFYADRKSATGKSSHCKSCLKAKAKRWYQENPDRVAEQASRRIERGGNRESAIKRKYGLRQADYLDMLKSQGGACAICGTGDPGRGNKHFVIDHCHETGKVRGLLCNNCNRVLGLFGDSTETIRSAIEYLKLHGK